MKYPMREKYLDEIVPAWLIFGTHSEGTVDISDTNRDVFTDMPPEFAAQVVELRDEFKLKLLNLIGIK